MKRPILSELTLREKIGQTAAVAPYVINKKTNPHEFLKNNPYGIMWTAGFIKMDFVNMANERIDNDNIDYDIDKKIRRFKMEADKYMKVPFLPATDAEGGVGYLFPFFEDVPSQQGRGAARDLDMAEKAGRCIGKSGRAAGTYWLWGPTADNPSPFNCVLNVRAFSSDPELSSDMIRATVIGMQAEGVAATLKHFPGADKYEYRDSHFSEMAINDDFDTWYNRQGVIFEAGIKEGALSVMIQHASFPAVDDGLIDGRPTPATLSRKIVTGLLKEQMGFKGVVVTDAVNMGALMGMYRSKEDFYVALYNAGNDVILGPVDEDFIDIVENAVKNGKIPEERIDDACTRVLDMKEKLGMFDETVTDVPDDIRKAIADETRALNEEYVPKIITTIANRDGLVPVNKENIKRVAMIYLGYNQTALSRLKCLKEDFAERGAELTIYDGIKDLNEIIDINNNSDLIIYVSHLSPHSPKGFTSYYEDKVMQLLYVFHVGREKSIVISTGSMFVHHDWFPSAATAFSLYSPAEFMLKGFVKGLYGECEFTGVPPFDPNPLAPRV